jgi:tripartite-type tricarboxylate transporter receptor subunit TctC
MNANRCKLGAALVLSLTVFTTGALAQGRYPDKPVRIAVGYAPGGFPDTVARVIGQKLGERWGQQVIVENRPGANSSIAAEYVQNAAPDGYTLLATDNSVIAVNPFLYKKLTYNPASIAPVIMIARAPLYLAAHSSFPGNSLAEMISIIKANPGKYAYGSSGIGSTHHLCMEFLKASLGLDMTHIPYKGTGQSVPAVVAGDVAFVWSALPSLAAQAKEGKIKFLAVNSPKRSSSAPTLPAVAETLPGFDFAPTIGLFAQGATPRAVVSRLVADMNEALKAADVIQRFSGLDIQTVGGSPEEFAAALKGDIERYSKAVKISGATAD